MKVLLINGSPHKNGCTATALREVEDTLMACGVETETVWLGTEPIAGCIACGTCRKTGKCFRTDIVNEVAEKLDAVDGIVVGSPVYYAGAAGQTVSFLNRLFYSASAKLRGKPGAAVVSCRRGGASAAFDMLNKYFTINNMPVVSSQYWNQVHGATPDDVRKDEEGLQTMRTLGRNMAWLLGAIKAGREQNIFLPESEAPLRTNFIQ